MSEDAHEVIKITTPLHQKSTRQFDLERTLEIFLDSIRREIAKNPDQVEEKLFKTFERLNESLKEQGYTVLIGSNVFVSKAYEEGRKVIFKKKGLGVQGSATARVRDVKTPPVDQKLVLIDERGFTFELSPTEVKPYPNVDSQ